MPDYGSSLKKVKVKVIGKPMRDRVKNKSARKARRMNRG